MNRRRGPNRWLQAARVGKCGVGLRFVVVTGFQRVSASKERGATARPAVRVGAAMAGGEGAMAWDDGSCNADFREESGRRERGSGATRSHGRVTRRHGPNCRLRAARGGKCSGGLRFVVATGFQRVSASKERGATAKPAVGAARRRRLGWRWHAAGAHRREAEMGSGTGAWEMMQGAQATWENERGRFGDGFYRLGRWRRARVGAAISADGVGEESGDMRLRGPTGGCESMGWRRRTGEAGDPSWSQSPATSCWRRQMRFVVATGFLWVSVLKKRWPRSGAQRRSRRWHVTGAHWLEAEMGSGVSSTGEDTGSSSNLGK